MPESPQPSAVGLGAALGFVYDETGPDRIVAHLEIGDQHRQPFGLVHGGVYCALVEELASLGGFLWLNRDGSPEDRGDGGTAVGVANHTNFLRAAREGTIRGVATPVHRGRSQQLWLVEVSDDRQRAVARGEVRLQNLPAPA